MRLELNLAHINIISFLISSRNLLQSNLENKLSLFIKWQYLILTGTCRFSAKYHSLQWTEQVIVKCLSPNFYRFLYRRAQHFHDCRRVNLSWMVQCFLDFLPCMPVELMFSSSRSTIVLVTLACTIFDYSTHVTDRRTDGWTDRIMTVKTHYSITCCRA